MSFIKSRNKRDKLQIKRYVPHIIDDKPIGMYIHIPFCSHKCPYCDFYSIPTEDLETETLFDNYTNAIITGISECSSINNHLRFDTIYFGGGTPTMLGASRLSAILKFIFKSFIIEENAEITFETNPATVSAGDLAIMKKAGFNRVSIGVQSFIDKELAVLGRIHTARTAVETIIACKEAGFTNISIDLMYGISGQTMLSWGASLTAALKAEVSHISFYSLAIEEGTPYSVSAPPNIPDDDLAADMYLNAVRFLESNGYEQYEISNFSLPGFRSRHNMKYWRCGEYLGFGPGAHSYYQDARYSYIKDVYGYIEAMKAGSDSILDNEPEIIRPRERIGEYLMLGLRLTDGINSDYFRKNYARDLDPVIKVLLPYVESGFVRYRDGSYSLTPKGFLVSNRIIGDVIDAASKTDSPERQ